MSGAEECWIDLAFPIYASQGQQISSDYPQALAQHVAKILPWWSTEPNAGVHPLKGLSACGQTWLVGGRTHLTLRISETRITDCLQLAGAEIDLNGKITLGEPRSRRLLAHPVVYSGCVSTGHEEEAGFVSYVRNVLDALGVSGQEIVGKKSILRTDGGNIIGFSLMIAGLSLENSVHVQRRGLGIYRSLGCGIFVPHRSINAVGL
jgi:CRISPR-associated protein Cas6